MTLGVVAVALIAWIIFHKKPAATPKPPPVPVSVATVSTQDIPVTITALGAAQAWTSDAILVQVSGILLSVDFVEGTNVKAGQLLAQIDPAPYQAALTQAQGRSNATRRCLPTRALISRAMPCWWRRTRSPRKPMTTRLRW